MLLDPPLRHHRTSESTPPKKIRIKLSSKRERTPYVRRLEWDHCTSEKIRVRGGIKPSKYSLYCHRDTVCRGGTKGASKRVFFGLSCACVIASKLRWTQPCGRAKSQNSNPLTKATQNGPLDTSIQILAVHHHGIHRPLNVSGKRRDADDDWPIVMMCRTCRNLA
jgi:hypothetical protein